MSIKQLQQEEDRISKAIATIQAELSDIGGDAYRGCWLDSTKDRTGTKTYTRLRWFIDVATKKKGSRILKGDEVGTATRAIALWLELATLEADLARVGGELRKVAELAVRLGLEMPTTRRQRRGDRKVGRSADVQGIPNGATVKVPRG